MLDDDDDDLRGGDKNDLYDHTHKSMKGESVTNWCVCVCMQNREDHQNDILYVST